MLFLPFMKTLDCFFRFFIRFRYPVTLPADIAESLGVKLSNFISFDELVNTLIDPACSPTKLTKLMPRKEAENAFMGAQRKESFCRTTLISYYFNEGWLEFNLQFDTESRLRRVYLQHKKIESDKGIELQLKPVTSG